MKTTPSRTTDQNPAFRPLARLIGWTGALLLASLPPVQAELISDFNDGVPDWDSLGLAYGKMDVEEDDGALDMVLRSGSVGKVNWNRPLDLGNGGMAELTADVDWIGTGGALLGFKEVRPDNTEVGYHALITPDSITVFEYWLDLNDPIYHPKWSLPISPTGLPEGVSVTVRLRLEAVEEGVKITLWVWDQSPERKLWIEETATDTKTTDVELGQPFVSFTDVLVGVIKLDPLKPPLRRRMDNLDLRFSPLSPPSRLGIRRADETSLELSWPGVPGNRYRLYRSDGDLSHFYPVGNVLTAGEEPLVETVPITDTPRSFFKHHEVPSSVPLLQAYTKFKAGVRSHDPAKVAATFDPDSQMDEVATLTSYNRQETEAWYVNLFRLFPNYLDTHGLVLAAPDLLVVEHQGFGTHGGDWDFGPLGTIPATGKTVTMPHLGVFDFEGDRIIKHTLYMDLMGLLAQLGAVPAPETPPLEPVIEVPDPVPTGLAPVETVLAIRGKWNDSDLAGYLAGFSDDADLFVAGFPPGLTRAQWAAVQEGTFAAFPDHDMRTTRIVDMGDGWVLSEVLWVGHNTGSYWGAPATGAEVMLRGVALDHITPEGLTDYSHVYFDNVTLLAQMGLLAPSAP